MLTDFALAGSGKRTSVFVPSLGSGQDAGFYCVQC
jgi:hypothetical protein